LSVFLLHKWMLFIEDLWGNCCPPHHYWRIPFIPDRWPYSVGKEKPKYQGVLFSLYVALVAERPFILWSSLPITLTHGSNSALTINTEKSPHSNDSKWLSPQDFSSLQYTYEFKGQQPHWKILT
jgi:hypothetical protein